uniref:receptor expression-enhancing protein 5-like isoform X1 n=1 Tax=Ciona intestinalis TaxID=7719 RepID=UPI000180BFCC|nr:receptor expression-enhancing protein 5-like isoform X1 [Ciona intestinalis]|eukprot:XP_002123923.1 receptor expression-enhancing protein 5-like isoform X1 [Ciona intestinalis]
MAMSPKNIMGKLDTALEQDNVINSYLDKIEKKTNVKKRYIVIAVGSLISLYLVFGYGADLLCNLIGFVYPAYVSVKAIESVNKDDDTAWLMYWVVFATFSVAEFFSDILLSWFPFYFLGKCIFLLWCMAPVSWNGSNTLYNKFIRPFILRNESKIDNVLSNVTKGAKDLVDQATKDAHSSFVDTAADMASEAVKEGLKKDE